MSHNKTQPTNVPVDEFLQTIEASRADEARTIISIMHDITKEAPTMWGPSIIGFGSQHYQYDTGREGEMGLLGFSPRKANLTIYFNEGFDRYQSELARLGPHTLGVSCLYIKRLSDITIEVLQEMLTRSFATASHPAAKPTTVDEYIESIPTIATHHFDELCRIVKAEIPYAEEVLSYGIVGYKIDTKRARVFIAGWDDHVSLYPIPKDGKLQKELQPYMKGKGTLRFPIDAPLPETLIVQTVHALVA